MDFALWRSASATVDALLMKKIITLSDLPLVNGSNSLRKLVPRTREDLDKRGTIIIVKTATDSEFYQLSPEEFRRHANIQDTKIHKNYTRKRKRKRTKLSVID